MDTQPNNRRPGKRTRRTVQTLMGTTILVILAYISVVGYTNSVLKAKEEALRANLNALNEAIDRYHADENRCPVTLEALVEEGYLRSVPEGLGNSVIIADRPGCR